jgi:hypothetical protein
MHCVFRCGLPPLNIYATGSYSLVKYAGGRTLWTVKANSRPKIAQPTTSCWFILHLAALPFRPLRGVLLVQSTTSDLSRPKPDHHSHNLAWPSHHHLHAPSPTALLSPGHTVAVSQTSWGEADKKCRCTKNSSASRPGASFKLEHSHPNLGGRQIRLPYSIYTSFNHGQIWGEFLTMRIDTKLFEDTFEVVRKNKPWKGAMNITVSKVPSALLHYDDLGSVPTSAP